MLDALPADVAAFYAEERNVLRDPQPAAAELAELWACGQTIGGDRAEYIAYFHRPETQFLWSWCRDGEQKACCAFKAVMKKHGIHQ